MGIEILGFDVPMWLLLCVAIGLMVYVYGTRNFGVWKSMGIQGPEPYPFLGTVKFWGGRKVWEMDMADVQKYGRVIGHYQGNRPSLMVADPDMLKEIQVKEFQSFTNHQDTSLLAPPLDNMVTFTKDDQWRRLRNTITPTFSSGKLRRMETAMNRCSRLLVENMMTKAKSGEAFDVKEHTGAFAMDVIASTAFGLDIDSQRDPNDPFHTHAKAFSNYASSPLLFVFYLLPGLGAILSKHFGISFINKDSLTFFKSIVEQALKTRTEADKDKRNDFLQLMVNAHLDDEKDGNDENEDQVPHNGQAQQQKKGITHDEILANCCIFFIAGYTTISDCLTFTLYLLAVNQDEQEKLHQEIQRVLKDDDDPDYDSMNKIQYLEMVINESLRILAPAVRTDRQCSQDMVIKGIHIPKGTIVEIPNQFMHVDPEHWQEPEKFDPERFSPERKADINPYCWQPFGIGPRHCIGMRLALMEIKMALVYMVKNFKIQTCDKTQVPIQRQFFGTPIDVFLKLEERV